MLKIFVLCALLACLSSSQAASNAGFITVRRWPEGNTRWVSVDENENASQTRMISPTENDETEGDTRWVSVDENENASQQTRMISPTEMDETKGIIWVKVDESENVAERSMIPPNTVINLENESTDINLDAADSVVINLENEHNNAPFSIDLTTNEQNNVEIDLENEPSYSPEVNDPSPNNGFITVESWPEPGPKSDEMETDNNASSGIVVDLERSEPEFLNLDNENSYVPENNYVPEHSEIKLENENSYVPENNYVPEHSEINLENNYVPENNYEPEHSEINLDNQDQIDDDHEHDNDGDDSTTSTEKPSSTVVEVTKKKDCSPQSKELKKAMFEWGYSNPQPLDEISERICPQTCTNQKLEWKGVYGSLDGKELTTCQCEKSLPSNIYSSRSSNMVIDMRQCEISFCDAMFNLHNDYRTKHRVENLTVDSDLSMQANNYAKELIKLGELKKSKSDGLYGESLVLRKYKTKPDLTDDICFEMGRKATAIWYDQSKSYDFKISESVTGGEAVDEFTQMVWKESTKFGCGLATDTSGRTFVAVARYTPKGNNAGQYKQNVLRPISSLNLLGWPFVNA